MDRELKVMPGSLGVFDLHDLSAGVMTAVGAYVVRQVFIAAIRAGNQVPCLQGIVCPAPIASTF